MSTSNALQSLLSAQYVMPDPGDGGTIKVDRDWCMVEMSSAAAETRVLDPPLIAGLHLIVRMATDGGWFRCDLHPRQDVGKFVVLLLRRYFDRILAPARGSARVLPNSY